MKVSVVVPAFNEEKLIGQSLGAIKNAMATFAESSWESELIVCDNNSTDRTADLARASGAKVVFEPVNQIARARNTGAEAASGDWLIFNDADSYPGKDLFGRVAEIMRSGRYLYGGSTIKLQKYHPAAAMITGIWNRISRMTKYAAGSFIFCEAAAFREIGGFDNRLFAGEEIDLSRRLKRLARKTGKKAIILHQHPLVTSARKMDLYSSREHLQFLARAICGGWRTAKDRAACYIWYDGRR
ncbi:MAG TPA: glycosyltransferase [Verrucomicrobiae bacterium]|nr:glycosyltransferase [Verrucomicrobiae bacterium]